MDIRLRVFLIWECELTWTYNTPCSDTNWSGCALQTGSSNVPGRLRDKCVVKPASVTLKVLVTLFKVPMDIWHWAIERASVDLSVVVLHLTRISE